MPLGGHKDWIKKALNAAAVSAQQKKEAARAERRPAPGCPSSRRRQMQMKKSARMEREAATVDVMIRQYCRMRRHSSGHELCADCGELLAYAKKRLVNCPFQEGKTTCGKCPVHCYRVEMREKIREVMRAVGPRMLLINPLMALRHAVDGLRKRPVRPG